MSGTLACLTALEAIKLIAGFGEPLLNQLLTMDLNRAEFAKRRPYREPNCPVCGERSQPVLRPNIPHHAPIRIDRPVARRDRLSTDQNCLR